jgi:transposase
LNAYIVFIDESGLLTSPLVRRTWAPRGETPILYQKGRSYERVSAIAALCISPKQRRYRLFFRLHRNISINKHLTNQFLSQLTSQLRRPAILVWDRLQVHRSGLVQAYISRKKLLFNEFLPPYAPELNPVEYLWGWLKRNPLANLPLNDAAAIAKQARKQGLRIKRKSDLLHSFVKQAHLFF